MKMQYELGMPHSAMSGPPNIEPSEKHYPAFHIESDKPLELPGDEGEMTIKFKKTSSSHSKSDGHERYSCTIEVREIVSAEGDEGNSAPAKNRGKDSENALDAIRKKKMGNRNDEDEGEY